MDPPLDPAPAPAPAAATASVASEKAPISIDNDIDNVDLDNFSLEQLIAKAKKRDAEEAAEASKAAAMQKEIDAENEALAFEEKLKKEQADELKRVQEELKNDLKARLRAPKKEFIDLTPTKIAIAAKTEAARVAKEKLKAETDALRAMANFKPMTFSAAARAVTAAEGAGAAAAAIPSALATTATGLPSNLNTITASSPEHIPVRSPSPHKDDIFAGAVPVSPTTASMTDALPAGVIAGTSGDADAMLSPGQGLPSSTASADIPTYSPQRTSTPGGGRSFAELYPTSRGVSAFTAISGLLKKGKRRREELDTSAALTPAAAVTGAEAGAGAGAAETPAANGSGNPSAPKKYKH